METTGYAEGVTSVAVWRYDPEAPASEFPRKKSKKIHSLALRACIEEGPPEH